MLLTPKGLRHILGKNCQKLPLFRATRKKMKKEFFFKIQTYKFVLEFFGNFNCMELKDYNI